MNSASHPPRADQDAEEAAEKVRRSAEIRDKPNQDEAEKEEIASSDFESHSELDRPEHNKGKPR
jgi:hypothetical protein